jgi:mono/diheme cytochrome c family protein
VAGSGTATQATGRFAHLLMGLARRTTLLFAACLVAAAPSAAQAAGLPTRGELLYSTHCIACHSREIHWRQKKLATDWASLEAQVRRWARNAGLGWSNEEIADVTRYLNAVHYRYAVPSVTGFERGDFRRSIAQAH